MLINLADYKKTTEVLGPKTRFVIWVQGCNKNCPECLAPNWQSLEAKQVLYLEQLYKKIYQVKDKVEGITISGGEPFLQAKAVAKLSSWLKSKLDLGIIVYSGYTYEELITENDKDVNELLDNIDLLIAGPYKKELNDNQGIRGSSNQEFYYFTDRYFDYKEQLEVAPRKVEIEINGQQTLLTGVPSQQLIKRLKKEER